MSEDNKDDKFSAYGSVASISYESGVLTQEMVEAAAEISSERGFRHSCENGHMVNPQTLKAKRGYCLNCCAYLDWSENAT